MSWENILKKEDSRMVWNNDIFAWSDKHKNWLAGINWEQIIRIKRGFPIWQIEKHINTQINDLQKIMQKIWDSHKDDEEDLDKLESDLGDQYQMMVRSLLNNTNELFSQYTGIHYDIETTDMTTGAVKLKWVK
jgi:thymidylate synthase